MFGYATDRIAFEQVIRGLQSGSAAARDLRGEPRVGLWTRTKIVPLVVDDRGAVAIEVRVRDLPVHGIGLSCPAALPRGS